MAAAVGATTTAAAAAETGSVLVVVVVALAVVLSKRTDWRLAAAAVAAADDTFAAAGKKRLAVAPAADRHNPIGAAVGADGERLVSKTAVGMDLLAADMDVVGAWRAHSGPTLAADIDAVPCRCRRRTRKSPKSWWW
jgi:hypothetical protein